MTTGSAMYSLASVPNMDAPDCIEKRRITAETSPRVNAAHNRAVTARSSSDGSTGGSAAFRLLPRELVKRHLRHIADAKGDDVCYRPGSPQSPEPPHQLSPSLA